MLAVVGSSVWLVLRGLALWRTIKAVGGSLANAVAAVERSAAAAETHAGSLAERSARLQASTARLEESLAQLAVLRAAAGDVGATVKGVRSSVPRK